MNAGFDPDKFRQQIKAAAGPVMRASATGTAAVLVWRLADQALADSGADLSRVACRAGCGDCCLVNVAVLAPEAEAILSWLRTSQSPDALQQLAARARTMAWEVRGLDNDERLILRRNCLFLSDSHNCLIHPRRPLLCRALTATDPEQCRDAITGAALGETRPIESHLLQQQIYHEAFSGLAAVLEESGRSSASTTLTEAIHQGLNS